MESEVRTIEVFMDQNNKCNLKCRMCGFSDPRVAGIPKYDMPIAVFRRIAERREMGASIPQLRINHVLSETNIDQFDAFLALAESLEAEAIDVRSIARFSNALDTGTSSQAFFEKICNVRERLDQWCERTGVMNVGALRWQPTLIEMFDEAGRKLTCRRPWNTVAIHANGDVMPCISWTRAPLGNIARENDAAVPDDEHDDFFYRMIEKPASPVTT